MSMTKVGRGIVAAVAACVLIAAAVSAEAREPRGSTTSDGPSSPYTDGRKKTKPTPKPKPSSNNLFICESNCPWPSGSSGQKACIQKCLNRLNRR